MSSVFSPLLLHHHHLSSSSASACLLLISLSSVSLCLVASSSHHLPLLCVLSVCARFRVSLLAVCFLLSAVSLNDAWSTCLVYCFLMGVVALLCVAAVWHCGSFESALCVQSLPLCASLCVEFKIIIPSCRWISFSISRTFLSLFPLLHCVCFWDFKVKNQVLSWFIMLFFTVDLTLLELSEMYSQKLSVFRYPIRQQVLVLGFKENPRKPSLKHSVLYRKRR